MAYSVWLMIKRIATSKPSPLVKDDLQDVLITLARIDERIVTIFNRQALIEARVNSMDEKIQGMNPAVKFGERVFWIVVAVIAAGAGKIY